MEGEGEREQRECPALHRDYWRNSARLGQLSGGVDGEPLDGTRSHRIPPPYGARCPRVVLAFGFARLRSPAGGCSFVLATLMLPTHVTMIPSRSTGPRLYRHLPPLTARLPVGAPSYSFPQFFRLAARAARAPARRASSSGLWISAAALPADLADRRLLIFATGTILWGP